VAPLDRRSQRALARRSVARSRGQQGEPALESGEQLLQGEDFDPSSRELDCERNPLESPAQLGQPLGIGGEAGLDGSSTLAEEFDRRRLGERIERIFALCP